MFSNSEFVWDRAVLSDTARFFHLLFSAFISSHREEQFVCLSSYVIFICTCEWVSGALLLAPVTPIDTHATALPHQLLPARPICCTALGLRDKHFPGTEGKGLPRGEDHDCWCEETHGPVLMGKFNSGGSRPPPASPLAPSLSVLSGSWAEISAFPSRPQVLWQTAAALNAWPNSSTHELPGKRNPNPQGWR